MSNEITKKMSDRGFRLEQNESGSGYVRDNGNGTETVVVSSDNTAPTNMHTEVWVKVYDIANSEPTHETCYVNLWEVI